MYPYLSVFNREIPMYSLMVLVGIGFAALFLHLREREAGELRRHSELLFLWGLLGAAAGAKLLWLLQDLPSLVRDLPLLFSRPSIFLERYLYGGFVFYGGLYGCLAAVWLYCRAERLGFDRVMQLFLPLFPLIHAFGRLGCFCVGCCYGLTAEDCPLAVSFTCSPAAPNGVPLIPVQLFEAAAELGLFAALALLSRRRMDGRRLLALYLSAYGLLRFALEFLRGDAYRGWVGPLSFSQALSLPTILLGVLLLILARRKTALPVQKRQSF